MPIESLFDGFDPMGDSWDRRLLFEVTGIRIDESDYRDGEEGEV